MKTEKILKKEINEVLSGIEKCGKILSKENSRLEKRLKKKLQYLKLCLLYVETHPKKEFLEKEKERLIHRVALIQDQFILPENHERMAKSELTKIKKQFESKMEVPKIKTHLSTINFLLK